MKGESCSSLGCARKVSNTIKWRDAGISVPVCPEHLVAFSNSRMEVTTETIPEWRQPDKAQAVLSSMLQQAQSLLDTQQVASAREVIKLAHDHIQNCRHFNIELDASLYNDVVSRITEE